MPSITPGSTRNALDRNAVSADRTRRNWQRLATGGVNKLIQIAPDGGLIALPNGLGVSVDGATIGINPSGQLEELHPIIINETPGGSIDGTNATFTLGNIPVDGTLLVFVDGLQMVETNDYTVSGNTFTFITGAIPMTGDSIRVTYRT